MIKSKNRIKKTKAAVGRPSAGARTAGIKALILTEVKITYIGFAPIRSIKSRIKRPTKREPAVEARENTMTRLSETAYTAFPYTMIKGRAKLIPN